jgi:hypothetical protein
MRTTPPAASSLLGAISVALIGTAFFFVIVGVFGLTAASGALALFVALALLTFRRPQAEGTQR